MLNYVRQFLKNKVDFHTLYPWKEIGDRHLFCNSSNSLPDCGENLKKNHLLENCRANVFKLYL